MKNNKKSYHTKKINLKLIVVNPPSDDQKQKIVNNVSEMLKIKYYS